MADLIAYDNHGNQIGLMSTNKGGGEGSIYFIQGDRYNCAKIFLQNKINRELHEKILSMLSNPPEDPDWLKHNHRSIAWPNSVLYENLKKNRFIGYTMPFLDMNVYREAHLYYDPSDRLNIIGNKIGSVFTWKDLFTVAYNLSSSVGVIHETGHCIGDLREANILVSPNALITLIDCDSFQIVDKSSGRVFFTRVGTGEYLPPELIGVDFKNKDYDRYYSDLFGLGILIFRLLMNGYHPYQARGSLVDEAPSPEAKIKKGYFAYAYERRDIKPPVDAPPYEIIPPSVRDLFYRCFVEGHKDPKKRPTAKEWFNTLRKELE